MDVGAMSVSVDDSDLGTKGEVPLLHEHVQSKVRPQYVMYLLAPRVVLTLVPPPHHAQSTAVL